MKKARICLNMIVKNEGHVIIQCLESIYHLIDYYVINDTGSTDDTREKIKTFFDSKGIKGEIINHEFRTCKCHGSEYKKYNWFHFGWNRTYALQKCKGKSEYIFFMDADDCIEGILKFPPKLTADQYYLTIRTDQNTYYKPLLIKNDPTLKWKWLSGIHEYLDGKSNVTMRLIGDYSVISRRLGARNLDPMKYYKDLECLEELLEEKPDDVRYRYYYAQTWFDAKEYQESIDEYQKVIDQSDDPDRIFSCQYMIGRSHILKGSSPDEIEKVFKECAEQHKHRAEPLFQLCSYFSDKGEFQKAYDYGIQAMDLPMSFHTVFYIDKTVYDYRLLDEMVLCASSIGKYRQALKWSQKLLEEKKYPKECHQALIENIVAIQQEIAKANRNKIDKPIYCLDKSKPCICFYVGPSPIFSKEKFGSELALMYLTQELLHTYNVFVAGDKCDTDQVIDSVNYIHSDSLHNSKFDTMIISRYINYFVEFDSKNIAKQTFIWIHDVDIHTYWNHTQLPYRSVPLVRNIDHLVSGYITLSIWHKKRIIETYKLDEQKIHIIGNGLYMGTHKDIKKVSGKFIWVSESNRGLVELISQFPKIIKEIPNAHLDIYRNLPNEIVDAIKSMSYIHLKGQATNKEILEAFAEAEYWYYPTKWNETYCISALEAQANGCICIASDLAALNTTIGNRGILLKEPIYTEEYWKSGLKSILELEGNPDMKKDIIQKGKEWAKEQTWDNIVLHWLCLLSNTDNLENTDKEHDLCTGNMFNRLKNLKRFGFEPKFILDIGANIGQWNITMKNIYPEADILSFEANPQCKSHLESKKIDHIITLLGDEDEDNVDFYTIANSECTTGASIYREKTSFYNDENLSTCKLKMTQLDDHISSSKHKDKHVDLMKLDVQGAEIKILDGALKTLERTDFVLLEISIMKYNEGSPLFAEVIEYMNYNGFKVFDILENHYINKFCMQTNILFLNKDSSWTTQIAQINRDNTHWKVNNIYE
jgi:FkbM family methyltransferase